MVNFCNYKNYLTNGLFSTPIITTNSYQYIKETTITGWTFNNAIILNGTNAFGITTPYPCGTQAFGIQMLTSITQVFNVPKSSKYNLIVWYCGRNCCDKSGQGNTLNITINGILTNVVLVTSVSVWNYKIIQLNLSAGQNTIEITGTSKTDRTTAIQLILTENFRSISSSAIVKYGNMLNIEKKIISDNQEYYTILQKDGNLCIYNNNNKNIWCSGKTLTASTASTIPFLTFNLDGTITIKVGSTTLWTSNVNKNKLESLSNTILSIDNDGILRIWSSTNTDSNYIVWQSPNIGQITTESKINETIKTEIIKTEIIQSTSKYDINAVPVYTQGNYGISPWGTNPSFPDKTAKWIWYTANSNIIAPVNLTNSIPIQYIYINNTQEQITGTLNVIIDNSCDIYLNSTILKSNVVGGWGTSGIVWNQINFVVNPGTNLFEFRVANSNQYAGLLVSAITSNSTILFNSNSSWKFVPILPIPIISSNLSNINLITTIDKSFPWGSLTLGGLATQYVNIGTTITGMEGLSFGCWFKSNSNSNFARIFDFGNAKLSDNIILFINGNSLAASIYTVNTRLGINDRYNLSTNINTNTWYHIVWTIQPTTIGAVWLFYLNNKLIANIQDVYPINIPRTKCYLGKSNWSSDPYFNGSMANFVMYQKVLSPNEIKALYYNMINLNDTKLYIYLPFSSNSVLDTLLNNYANYGNIGTGKAVKTFNLITNNSSVKSENWNCLQESSGSTMYTPVKIDKSNTICMSLDGTNCIYGTKSECVELSFNPATPYNPVICGSDTINSINSNMCIGANNLLKSLNQPDITTATATTTTNNIISESLNQGISIDKIKPGIGLLDSLNESKVFMEGKLSSGGKPIQISSLFDVNKLMVGGIFKLKVNLPFVPPYIKGSNWDQKTGSDKNYFYLSVEKLDPNCNIKTSSGNCYTAYADEKNCSSKSLTTYNVSNSYRLVLIPLVYALEPVIPLGKSSDWTIIQLGSQYYLKNVQTGYLPSLYSDNSTIQVYGDMEVSSNSNVSLINNEISNTLCTDKIPPVQTEGTAYVKCDIKKDPGLYLMMSKNIGTSSPIRININNNKTIGINLLSFNSFGHPTKNYALTQCNFNVKTFAFIEKITNNLGEFLVNMVCFTDTTTNNQIQKNQLEFTVELMKFPTSFIKDNSVFDIN